MVVAIVQNVGDVVHMCGYEEEDLKMTFIGKGIIKNVASGMLHSRVTSKFYISLTITESYKDDYPLLEPVNGDDLQSLQLTTQKARVGNSYMYLITHLRRKDISYGAIYLRNWNILHPINTNKSNFCHFR